MDNSPLHGQWLENDRGQAVVSLRPRVPNSRGSLIGVVLEEEIQMIQAIQVTQFNTCARNSPEASQASLLHQSCQEIGIDRDLQWQLG